MRKDNTNRQAWIMVSAISVLFLASAASISAQDPCDIKRDWDDAIAKQKTENTNFKNATTDSSGKPISKPAPPTGDDKTPLNKASLDKSLELAKDAFGKTEALNNANVEALRKANEALSNFSKDESKGGKLATLKADLAKLEADIKKAEDAKAKATDADKQALADFHVNNVMPLAITVRKQMPGLSLESAKANVDDPSYVNFKNDELDGIRNEIKRNQDFITRTNAKYTNSNTVPTDADDENVEKAKKAIAENEPLLKPAIDKARNQVREDLKPLRRAEQEYDRMQEKLYPDQATRDLIDALPKMLTDQTTKKAEQKTLTDAKKTLEDAVKPAKEKVDGGTKDGKAFKGSKESLKEDGEKIKTIETNLTKLANYETNNKTFTDAEKPKKEADDKVNGLKPVYDPIVTAKNAAIATARTSADSKTIKTRMAVVNADLMEKARTDTFNSGIYKSDKAEQTQLYKLAKTPAEKQKIKRDWDLVSAARVQERYVGLRNEAEAARLETVRDNPDLVRYQCFNDVEEIRNKLSQLANNVRKLKVSTGSGADFEFEGENEKEKINVGPIPPLDEGESEDEPTDEVPDDIKTGTGQVKVIQYFVFVLTNSSNGLYVGSEDSLKGTVRCGYVGGGIGCKPTDVITYRKLAGPFATQGEAQASLCQNITESRIFPIGIGLKGKWQGGTWYGLWNAGLDGCSK